MVTGIETAGLVLAAFPLLISALEHYVSGIETIHRWRRFKRELAKYVRRLETQRIWVVDTLEELLDGIVNSNEELAPLINDPNGPSWRDPEHDRKVRLRLGSTYDHYMATLARMLGMLEDMGGKLSKDVLWSDSVSLSREMHRLKFVLSGGVYNAALDDIDKANKDLREFTHQSLRLEPSRSKRRYNHVLAHLRTIRRQAASLYKAVVVGSSWVCECKGLHVASLRLEPRPRPGHRDAHDTTTSNFRILVSSSKAFPQWRELSIETEEISRARLEPCSAGQLCSAKEAAKNPDSQAQKPSEPRKKRIRFATPPRQVESKALAPAGAADEESRTMPILNMCSSICSTNISGTNLGFLIDDGDVQHRHQLRLMNDAKHKPMAHTKTLDSLLVNTSQGSSGSLRLTRHDRLYVGATLASSVLQLEKTAWLKQYWTSSDIHFHYPDMKTSSGTRGTNLDPYISWNLADAISGMSIGHQVSPLKDHLVRSEPLLTLGLTLIELCFGKTMTQLKIETDIGANDQVTRLNTARRLLDQVYDESGGNYGDVVRRCLFCPFDVRKASVDNDDFQEAVFDNIVTPLFDDLEAFAGPAKVKRLA